MRKRKLKSLNLVVLVASAMFVKACITISDFDRGHLEPAPVQPVEITYELERGLIILEASINGVQGRFIFDNGFSLSAVNTGFAQRAGIEFSGRSNIRDANSIRTSLPETTVERADIGGQVFVDTGFYLVDTDLFLPCASVDGIIGASIINKINWHVDFNSQVILMDSTPFENVGITINTSVSSNNSSFARFKLNGLPIKAKIDFGSTNEFKLGAEEFYSSFIGEKAEARTGIASFSATGPGKSDTRYTLTDTYSVASNGQQLPAQGGVVLTQKMKYQAYVGIDWFKKYDVTINSSRKEYVLATPEGNPIQEKESSWSVSVYPIDGVYRVIQLNTGDEIAKELTLMEEVTAIDDLPVDSFSNICDFRSHLQTQKAKEESLTIQVAGRDAVLVVPFKIADSIILE